MLSPCWLGVVPFFLVLSLGFRIMQALQAYGNIDVYTSSFRPMRNTIRCSGGAAAGGLMLTDIFCQLIVMMAGPLMLCLSAVATRGAPA